MTQYYFKDTFLANLYKHLIAGALAIAVYFSPLQSYAQATFCDGSDANAGNIKLDGPFGNPTILNPDADNGSVNIFNNEAYDVLSGLPEISQFKQLISSGHNNSGTDISGNWSCDITNLAWREIPGLVNGAEPHNDLSTGAGCGPTDIIHDGNSSGYGYFTVVDQDCDPNTSDDAFVIVRIRIAKESNGAFGFSLLIDTDNSCGSWTPDLAANCPFHCFDREIWLGTGQGQTGLHIKDVSGSASPGTEIGIIPIEETQVACTSQAVSACKVGSHSTIFYTFAVPIDMLGISPGFVSLGAVVATSVNPDDVIDGNYALSDIGGLVGVSNTTRDCDCTGLTGSCLNLCLLSCVSAGNTVTFPVEFLGFNGKFEGSSVHLEWSTGQEHNNQKFVIERLTEEKEFQSIGEVPGSGTTEMTSFYFFNDPNPLPGSNIYRLKQIDFNGQFHYSHKLEVNSGAGSPLLSIHPNMVAEEIPIQVFIPEAQELNIQVFSAGGKLQMSKRWLFTEGSTSLSLPATSLAAGIYLVAITDKLGDVRLSERFVKF